MAPTVRPRPAARAAAFLLIAALGALGCASGAGTTASSTTASSTSGGTVASPAGGSTGTGTGTGTSGAGAGQAASANAEAASVEFVTAAVGGGDAAGYLAPDPVDDPAVGAPYTPQGLTARLADLAGLASGQAGVRPSTTAHPTSVTGPACDGARGEVCDIEVFDGSGRLRATVIVHWSGGGVTDFVIVDPSDTGTPGGVGRAVCSPGFNLIVGGHGVDRFDVAVCADPSGTVEYQGASRENGKGITIAACAAGADAYRATNNGFGYTVSGADGPQRGRLTVLDPAGKTVVDTVFTPFRATPAVPLTPC